MDKPNKYSLWIVPKDEPGKKLQDFVSSLAKRYDAPNFIPHLTLVANIFISSEEERLEAEEKIKQLAKSVGKFSLTLADLDYKDEEFRCLYLLAHPSPELDNAYQVATDFFPQVADEHFRSMPHMSVLYGNYSSDEKDKIIANNPISEVTFDVHDFDLFLTNSPIESWKLEEQFTLKK